MSGSSGTDLGTRVGTLCASAKVEVILCAPFVKRHAVERILEGIDDKVHVTLYTRWRPEEVAAGVSDLDVFELVSDSGGTTMLCDQLHGKLFVGDSAALVGSANLTGAALGWSRNPNLELLVAAERSSADVIEFERRLIAESYAATKAMADQIAHLAEKFGPPSAPGGDDRLETEARRDWAPSLRQPADLFRAYSEGCSALPDSSADLAARDLEWADVPPGLSRTAFEAAMAQRVLTSSIVRDLDELLREPQRFGAVADFLSSRYQVSRTEAKTAWQTLMRWLTYFLPERYAHSQPNYSEIFELKCQS